MLNLQGNICLGYLDNYEDTFVLLNEKDKGVILRNWMTVGTIGSGQSNTNQVLIEETLATDFAQVVIDPEDEYIFMDQPLDAKDIAWQRAHFERKPQGVNILPSIDHHLQHQSDLTQLSSRCRSMCLVGTFWEDIVLWTIIFLVGFGVGAGFLGL